MTDDVWAAWRAARPPTELLHLDSAAVGRSSTATLDAVTEHALAESVEGGYVAQELAQPVLAELRRDVATLCSTDEEGIAFTESAMASLEALLRAWPLPEDARVAVAASEWGPNIDVLDFLGIKVVRVPVDADGAVDLDALDRFLADDPPDALLLDHVAAHRGLVQPAGQVIEQGRRHGVPVLLDAAQSLGHLVVPPGADAVFATSRKWLTGPRGVGIIAVAEQHRSSLRVLRPGKHPDRLPVHLLEPDESHVAGRVGLRVAVGEYVALGPASVEERLRDVGRRVRELAATLDGWEVVHPSAPAGALTSLRPTNGQDVANTQQRLLHGHRILTTVSQPWRAPAEMDPTEPWLRLSPHVDLTTDDLEHLARALSET
ncbi:MAG: aminotransferase class V-fold PLP-dependent enzyme [Marmoricola sp.]